MYPIKDEQKNFLVASQTTVNRPLGDTKLDNLITHHFTRCLVWQEKEPGNENDHIIQRQTEEAYDFKLLNH